MRMQMCCMCYGTNCVSKKVCDIFNEMYCLYNEIHRCKMKCTAFKMKLVIFIIHFAACIIKLYIKLYIDMRCVYNV